MDLERLRATVARLTVPGKPRQGTAFLVGRKFVITCAHCLGKDENEYARKVTLEFSVWPEAERYSSADLTDDRWVDWDLDIAVLRLNTVPREGASPLPLATTALRGDDWGTFAYPEQEGSDGAPAYGNIVDPNALAWNKRRIRLESPQAKYRVNGMSGGAIVAAGRIVGVIGRQRLERDDTTPTGTAPVFETIFAVPIGLAATWLRERLPEIQIEDTTPFGPLENGFDRVAGDATGYLDYYLGAAVPFGGRDRELGWLDRWLSNPERPFALIAAPSGRGKSAIVTRWAARLRADHLAHVAFVPVSIRFNTSTLGTVGSLLLARLRHLHGEGGRLPAEAEAIAREIKELCQRERASGMPPLVVILDGMDEAGGWTLDMLGLPARPSSRVKVLVTLRSPLLAQKLVPELGWDPKLVAASEGIDALLEERAVFAAAASVGFDEPGLAARLSALSEGDPLLLRLYVDGLVERRRSGVAVVGADLADVRPGWQEYLARWWREQRALWGGQWPEARVDVLLALLTSARGPISRRDVLEVTRHLSGGRTFDARALDAALSAAARFLTGVRLAKGEEGFVLSHPKLPHFFAVYLRDELGFDLDEYERALLAYCRDAVQRTAQGGGRPEDVSDYALRHWHDHARRAGEALAVGGVATRAWREAHRLRSAPDESSADVAFLDDVRVLAELAHENACSEMRKFSGCSRDELGKLLALQARCALIHASIASRTANWTAAVVRAMLDAKRLSPAQAYVIVANLGANGRHDRRVAKQMVALAPELDDALLARACDDARLDAITRIPLLLERARRAVGETERHDRLAKAMRGIRTLGRGFDQLWALALLVPVIDERWRARCAERIATRALSKAGHPVKRMRFAAAVAVHMPEPERGEMVRHLLDCELREREGHPDYATDAVLLGFFHPFVKEDAAGRMLVAMDRLSDSSLRDKRFAELAPHLAELGHKDAVLQRAFQIESVLYKVKALAGLSRYFPARNLLDEALRIAAGPIGDGDCAVATQLQLASQAAPGVGVRILRDALVHAVLLLEDPSQLSGWALEIIARHLPGEELEVVANRLLSAEPDWQQEQALVALTEAADTALRERMRTHAIAHHQQVLARQIRILEAPKETTSWTTESVRAQRELAMLMLRSIAVPLPTPSSLLSSADVTEALHLVLLGPASSWEDDLHALTPRLDESLSIGAWNAVVASDLAAAAKIRIALALGDSLPFLRNAVVGRILQCATGASPREALPSGDALAQMLWPSVAKASSAALDSRPSIVFVKFDLPGARYATGIDVLERFQRRGLGTSLDTLMLAGARIRSHEDREEMLTGCVAALPDAFWWQPSVDGLEHYLLEGVPAAIVYPRWQLAIAEAARHSRSALLFSLATFAPILHRMGGDPTVLATADAVAEIERWWP